MIRLLYCNVSEWPDDHRELYLPLLPLSMQQEIGRYRHINDQKLRLAGRLMLMHCLQQAGCSHLIHSVRRNENNKPVIDNWHPFNISHSGDWVVFCYGDDWVGIDIEKREAGDYHEILKCFHPEEQQFINASADKQKSFYNIWVKKEAFLKASGTGITGGVNEFSCICSSVQHNGRVGYFHEFFCDPGYTGFICCSNNSPEIAPYKFQPETMLRNEKI
jgi:4'-phosphopantetheinyl transferase